MLSSRRVILDRYRHRRIMDNTEDRSLSLREAVYSNARIIWQSPRSIMSQAVYIYAVIPLVSISFIYTPCSLFFLADIRQGQDILLINNLLTPQRRDLSIVSPFASITRLIRSYRLAVLSHNSSISLYDSISEDIRAECPQREAVVIDSLRFSVRLS